MPRHVLAYVRMDQLRGPDWDQPGNIPAFKARFYGSRSPKLHQTLGDHGTLWLATGISENRAPMIYVLAYKLSDCERLLPEEAIRRLPEAYLCGQYAVVARDMQHTHHFSLKQKKRADLTPYIALLRFENTKPVTSLKHFPTWLYNFPILTEESAALLERLERRSRYGRDIVISYAREDREIAETLQRRLEGQGLQVYRDLTALRAGENWRQGVQDALEIADALLVLLSPYSNDSPAVQSEVHWGLQRLGLAGGLGAIVPLLLPGMDFNAVNWPRFELSAERRLQDLTCLSLPVDANENFFANLVEQIAELTASGK